MKKLLPLLNVVRMASLLVLSGCPETPEQPTAPGTGLAPVVGQPGGGSPGPTPSPTPAPAPTPQPTPTSPPAGSPGTLTPVVGPTMAPAEGWTPPPGGPLLGRQFSLRARCVERELGHDIGYTDPAARTCNPGPATERRFDFELHDGALVSVAADGAILVEYASARTIGDGRNEGALSADGATLAVNFNRAGPPVPAAARPPTCNAQASWQNIRDHFQVNLRYQDGQIRAEGSSVTTAEQHWPAGAGCYQCGGVFYYKTECTYSFAESPPEVVPTPILPPSLP